MSTRIRKTIATWLLVTSTLLAFSTPALPGEDTRPPNIVFILADDLGYGEVGCYGQKKIQTPNIDRLAQEGMRFTQCYSGCHVCAPSRSTLLTGLHTGHTPIRANGGGMALAPDDVTFAKLLKEKGYATGGFGKWGLGVENSTGSPVRQGFDEFFGYYHQVHAHFFYPYFLWNNEERFALPENEGRKQARYSHDVIEGRALDFIRRNKDRPFFCYMPFTLPHVELVVPEDSLNPYLGKWPETPLPDPRPGYISPAAPYAAFAGMVSRLDRSVGRVMALLKELHLDDNTVVFFTSDNGPQGQAWQRVADFFEGKANLRGYKGTFYEGGIRVPLLVRWPGKIRPGSTSDHACAFWDMLPTFVDLAGAKSPDRTDGISIVPTLLGRDSQRPHDFLYWEYPHANGFEQALRQGDWKLVIPPGKGKAAELFNLKSDPSEATNVAEQNREIVNKMKERLREQHTAPRKYPPARQVTIKDYVK